MRKSCTSRLAETKEINEAEIEDRQKQERQGMKMENAPDGSRAEVKGWSWRGGKKEKGVRRVAQLTGWGRGKAVPCGRGDGSHAELKSL